VPTLRHERLLLREGHALVAGVDEVGRGALAGPVTVGVVAVHAQVRSAPSGVRDSKLLTPAAREALVPKLRRWAPAYAVGHAEPDEVDRYGIIAALRLAGRRALATLPQMPTCVLLDGSHDWLTAKPPSAALPTRAPLSEPLFEGFDEPVVPRVISLDPAGQRDAVVAREAAPDVLLPSEPFVRTMVKADLRCAAVAAASVLAKVERDAIMVARSAQYPGYGWHENKGYSAPDHLVALRDLGPCEQHRLSWSLPGAGGPPQVEELFDLGELDDDADELEDVEGVEEDDADTRTVDLVPERELVDGRWASS
jgi:ribonuclease HII